MLPVPEIRRGRRRLTGAAPDRYRHSSIIPRGQPNGRLPAILCARGYTPGLSPDLHCVWARAGVKLSSRFIWSVSMQIEERSVGDVVVLDLKGKITLGEGDELLKDKVNSLVNQGHKKIVLNLADVPYIDSAGLGEVVRTYTTVSRQGGSLKLLNLTKRITDLLSITKLLTVFETFDSENEAVRSFSASAKV
jgi:anti-sigma B factor antagonist